MHTFFRYSLTILAAHLSISVSVAQDKTPVVDSISSDKYIVISAGKYKDAGFHNFFFGKHYRKEWNTPVRVPVMMLDTTVRGLEPYQSGGGRQTKSLRLRDANDREYVLRSLDKSFGRALPELYRGTFIEDVIDDQVTIAHPYSAFTIPPMAKAAKIYHTNPRMGYVPKQSVLDSFNEEFGDRLYLLEQRADENWETASNFGYSKKIISTEKMIGKVYDDNDNRIDQLAYIRARLFDFVIGDWGRHEDQWRWATIEEAEKNIYRPIPRDRDQAYTKFDGVLSKLVLSAANLDHLQSYDEEIEGLKFYGFPARHLDRFCTNEPTLNDWVSIAKDLQKSLTDSIIETSVRRMPPEVFPIRGEEIIRKLKSRRDHLHEYAEGYYKFLARHVEVTGSKGSEFFKVQRLNDDETRVEIFNITKEGELEEKPYYSRTFKTSETKDVRLYGLSGKDKYLVDGETKRGINIRIIGGNEADSIVDQSSVARGARKTNVYDDEENQFVTTAETDLHLSDDTLVHEYKYQEYEYHKRGIRPLISYNNPDRIYASVGYRFSRHKWRKAPFGFQQALYFRYSISQNAFSILYEGQFYQAFGKWDAVVTGNYDAIRWTNFYGLGNETTNTAGDNNYYRLRTRELNGSVGIGRVLRKYHTLNATLSFQSIGIVNDAGRYVAENYTPNELYYYEHHNYTGVNLGYSYQNVNDRGIPTKGVMFYSGLSYTLNIGLPEKDFIKYTGILQAFVPLSNKFSLSIRSGLATVSGEPEFYQYVSVGGSQTLRGHRRDRFWGNTAFYNNNDLRYITPFKSYLVNGKAGFLVFMDNGRVWYDREQSNLWHVSYGGGVLLAPFNKFMIALMYGISQENQLLHFRLNKLL